MRILLDENLDWRLERDLPGHDVSSVPRIGWAGIRNGELLLQAEEQFDVLITMDSGLVDQQKLAGRDLILVLLRARSNRLADTKPLMPSVLDLLENAQPGALISIPQMTNERIFNRITLIVLDGAGIGAMPDAPEWGDAGSDTFGHICESRQLKLPNLQRLGLGNIRPLNGVAKIEEPSGCYGKCALKSNGKDTTTGHWEMAGIVLERPFPTYPNGFPQTLIDEFIAKTNVPGVLGNFPASGTEIIKDLGEEHVSTGKPIVYTSADSVFQIAAHEEVFGLDRLYEISEIARDMLRGEHEVGRVIARPFLGKPGSFFRTENRHDYAVPPPRENLLPLLSDNGLDVVSVGKIASIYDSTGVTQELVAKNNQQSMDQTIAALRDHTRGLIFSNFVDFDMLYGHRRDTEGYARALEHFDARWPELESSMRDDDLVILTADHGNDPTYPGTDHTREYAPLIVYGKRAKAGVSLGTRESLSDIGKTIAENFGLQLFNGESFLSQIR